MLNRNIKLFLVFSCIFIVLSGLASISAVDPENTMDTDDDNPGDTHITPSYDDNVRTNPLIDKKSPNTNGRSLKTSGESNRYLYVNSTGNSSSDGTDPENPTTLTNAFNSLEDNDTIMLLANQTYNIIENISTKNLNANTKTFTITSQDRDSVVVNFFSTSNMEFAGNQRIKIENISFKRQFESEHPIITNNATLLEISHCTFYNIKTTANRALIYNTKNMIVTDSYFYNNTGENAAGVIYSENATLNMTGNIFDYNNAYNGAVVSSSKSLIYSLNNSFVNNNASFGGVFSLRDNSTLKDEKSFYNNNRAKYYGGAVYSYYSNISVDNSIFTNNNADNGGVFYSVNNRNTSIVNSLLENNTATNAASVAYSSRDNLTINNCVLICDGEVSSVYCHNGTCNLDNNWWGQNNPNFAVLTNNLLPNNWRLMTLNALYDDSTYTIEVSLNRLTDNTITNHDLIGRTAEFTANNGDLEFETLKVSSSAANTFTGNPDDLTVRIDREEMGVNDKIRPYLNILNSAAYINDTTPIIVKCNPDITGDIPIYVDGEYYTSVVPVNGTGIIFTEFNSTWQEGTHTLSAVLVNNTRYEDTLAGSSLILRNMTDPVINRVTYNVAVNISNESVKTRLRLNESQLVQTSVKNQGASGSCWAFSTIATLESAYLKAYGIEYDFSENNMKNVLKKYSTIGDVASGPNEGNGELAPISLLVGWYGPADELDDPYYDRSITSPLLKNSVKVQDVYFIYRNSFIGKDNKALKEAILKYGALSSSVYSSYNGFYGKSVYTDATAYADHAITIVGWDDFYSASNFYGSNRPPNAGAYIIKDSWGESIGDGGYQYVSYYDTSLAGVNLSTNFTGFSYAFPVQTYENYTNIYQHDTISTNIRMMTPSGWIRNVYTAERDESIAAVGTFIFENCDYEAYVYVNDRLAYSQTGNFTQAGFRTIKFKDYVSVNEGDTFRVDLKLQAHKGTYTAVTIQDTNKYKSYSGENQSFISNDGENWMDLFYDSEFAGSAACLKVYTRDAPRLVSTVTREGSSITVSSMISNLNSNGRLSYTLDDEYYTDDNGNVVYVDANINKTYDILIIPKNIRHSTYNLTVNLDVDNYTYSETFTMTMPLNLKIDTENFTYYVDDEQTITARVTVDNDYSTPADEGTVLLIMDSAVADECNVTNGSVTFNINRESGNYTYTLVYVGSTENTCENVTANVEIKKHEVIMEIDEIGNQKVNRTVIVTGTIHCDDAGIMSHAPLEVEIGEDVYSTTSDENGRFLVNYAAAVGGEYTAVVRFNENGTHHPNSVEVNFTIEKLASAIALGEIGNVIVGSDVIISGNMTDENGHMISDVTLNVKINTENYVVAVDDGYFEFGYTVNANQNNVTLTFWGNDVYESSCASQLFNAKKESTFLFYNIKSCDKGDVVKISAKLLSDGLPVVREYVSVTVNEESHIVKTSTTGYFTLDYVAQTEGINTVTFDYEGSDEYLQAHNSTTFIVRKDATFLFYKIRDTNYGETVKISAKLLSDNNPVKGQTVTIQINNETQTIKTSTTGYFAIDYMPTNAGINNLSFIFNGNAEYAPVTNHTTFTVNEQTVKQDVTFLFYKIGDVGCDENVKISGKLLCDNSPVKNRNVSVIINGESYVLKTSSTGYFVMEYLTHTCGVNNLTFLFDGDSEYYATGNSTSFNVKNKTDFLFYHIKDVQMGSSVKISGKLLSGDVPAVRQNVSIIINDKVFNLTTSTTGYFVMDYLTSTGGTYDLTYLFEGSDSYHATQNSTTFNVLS